MELGLAEIGLVLAVVLIAEPGHLAWQFATTPAA